MKALIIVIRARFLRVQAASDLQTTRHLRLPLMSTTIPPKRTVSVP
jgi:hypothetical protein